MLGLVDSIWRAERAEFEEDTHTVHGIVCGELSYASCEWQFSDCVGCMSIGMIL